MVNPFQIIAQRLLDLGAFGFFLPWVITAAVFWGLLKKSGIFDTAINAILSISLSFFIWGFLITASNADIGAPLSAFITQGFVIMIVFVFSLVAASMFYPKLGDVLTETIKNKSIIWMFLGLFIILFFTSGLFKVMFVGPFPSGIQGDVMTMTIILVALVIGILVLTVVQKSQAKKE